VTHAAPEALHCSELFAELLRRALAGAPKTALLSVPAPAGCTPAVQALARGDWRDKPADAIRTVVLRHDERLRVGRARRRQPG
jgi:ADP-ribosyl-[dinitrogen reductase] hydrolase